MALFQCWNSKTGKAGVGAGFGAGVGVGPPTGDWLVGVFMAAVQKGPWGVGVLGSTGMQRKSQRVKELGLKS